MPSNLYVIPPFPPSAKVLTRRQLEVAGLAGLRHKEIAYRLNISPRTVAAHMSTVMVKTGLDSKTAVALWAALRQREAA